MTHINNAQVMNALLCAQTIALILICAGA